MEIPAPSLPPGLSDRHRRLLLDLVAATAAARGEDLLGLVLSGSAGRGVATDRSDLDVHVVLAENPGGTVARRSALVDEIPVTLAALERVPEFGSPGWWFRWSFAWTPVVLDRTNGRLAAALRAQATVTPEEAEQILLEHQRLGGWMNYAFRSLKSDRDGRRRESRLDAVESLPWLLDVVFSLAGRVRPYHKYLPWELEHHPLVDWPGTELLDVVEAVVDGDPAALRHAHRRVAELCADHDRRRGGRRLLDDLADWDGELPLFRRGRRSWDRQRRGASAGPVE